MEIYTNREDEMKLYQAYEVLDRLINKHSTFNDMYNAAIEKIFERLNREFGRLAFLAAEATNYMSQSKLQHKINNMLKNLKKELRKEQKKWEQ